jgi:uncharacterized protein (DUF779 family)
MKDVRIEIRAGRMLRSGFVSSLFFAILALPLSSCGNGNLFNGVGGNGTGTLNAAETTALVYISNGNYLGAAQALASYCPNNTCPDVTSATILADAYIALGTAPNSSYSVTQQILLASPTGTMAGTNQIISNLVGLSSTNGSATDTFKAIAQAVPCIAGNDCTTSGLQTTATALEVLINSGCSSSSCPSADLASMYLLAAAVYTLANLQYSTGITYSSSGWEVCPGSGAGTSPCSALTASDITTFSSKLGSSPNYLADNCYLMFNTVQNASTVCSNTGGTSSFSNGPSLSNVVSTVAQSLGTNSVSVTNSVNELLNTIADCTGSLGTSCTASTVTSAPTTLSASLSFQTAASNYLGSL